MAFSLDALFGPVAPKSDGSEIRAALNAAARDANTSFGFIVR